MSKSACGSAGLRVSQTRSERILIGCVEHDPLVEVLVLDLHAIRINRDHPNLLARAESMPGSATRTAWVLDTVDHHAEAKVERRAYAFVRHVDAEPVPLSPAGGAKTRPKRSASEVGT
jgi:hypothetical protein